MGLRERSQHIPGLQVASSWITSNPHTFFLTRPCDHPSKLQDNWVLLSSSKLQHGKAPFQGHEPSKLQPPAHSHAQQWGNRTRLSSTGRPISQPSARTGWEGQPREATPPAQRLHTRLVFCLGNFKDKNSFVGQSLHNHSITSLIPAPSTDKAESLQDPPESKFRTGGTMLNLPLSSLARGVRASNVTTNARPTKDKMLDKYYSKASSLDPISISLSLFFNSLSLTPTLYLHSRPPQLKEGLGCCHQGN